MRRPSQAAQALSIRRCAGDDINGNGCDNAESARGTDLQGMSASAQPNRAAQACRGANMITAMPSKHRPAPSRSQRVGRIDCTAHSHSNATAMYTPPYAA